MTQVLRLTLRLDKYVELGIGPRQAKLPIQIPMVAEFLSVVLASLHPLVYLSTSSILAAPVTASRLLKTSRHRTSSD